MNFLSLGITFSQTDQRLDLLLQAQIETTFRIKLSRNELKQWFKEKLIQRRHSERWKRVKPSDHFPTGLYEIRISPLSIIDLAPIRAHPSKQGSFMEILYESKMILALNKTPGIPSQPLSPSETETAVGSALSHEPSLYEVKSNPLEPGLLHRLDVQTSGVLCFAKSTVEFQRLKAIWNRARSPKVIKSYRAIVFSKKAPKPQWIKESIAPHLKTKKKMTVSKRKSAQNATTQIVSIEFLENNLYDLEIRIQTGVRHQIRAHLSFLKISILGDLLYGGKPSSRMWLHSWKLNVPQKNGKEIQIEAPMPHHWPTQ